MPTTYTLGSTNRRTRFVYSGSISTGVTLHFSGSPRISRDFFEAILDNFAGQTVVGGFSMTDPRPDGFGCWVQQNSKKLNGTKLSPRHASFIAAILVHENRLKSSLKGNAIYLHFVHKNSPPKPLGL